MITKQQIIDAKNNIGFDSNQNYEHDDCIQIAYQWLDAQKKLKVL